jgi:hypothetical protein
MARSLLLLCLVALSPLAMADDETAPSGDPPPSSDDPLGLDAIMGSIDLGGGSGTGNATAAATLNYDGSIDQSANEYAKGKPVTITHSAGSISVRCQDRPGMSARITYNLRGTAEGPMEQMGKGIGISVVGGASGGSVKTRVPSKPAAVKESDISLVVNLPQEAAITVVGGAGFVQVMNCKGSVKASNKSGGIVINGTYTNVNLNAASGDVNAQISDESKLVGSNSANAAGGNVSLTLPMSYGGKFSAKGKSVSVFQTVVGTNTGTLVQGTISTGNAALNISAGQEVKVTPP